MSEERFGEVVQDETGTLISGAFFEIRGFDSRIIPYSGQDKSWVVIVPDPSSDELAAGGEFYAYGSVIGYLGSEKTEHHCEKDGAHVTNHWYGGYEVDLFGGPRVAGFVETLDGPFAVPHVIDRLRQSDLRGFQVRPIKLQDEVDIPGLPRLQEIVFLGRNCLRPRKVVGAPNACPFCGRAPLICPDCGHCNWTCEQCGNGTMIGKAGHKGRNDHRLVAAMVPPEGRILEGRRWDGSDFVQAPGTMLGLVMSKRALDFFASIHAAPLIAQPMRICTDGMSEEQLHQLEQVM